MGGKSTSSTTTTQLPPELRQAYKDLVGQAQGIYNNTSYTPYSGGSSNSLIDAANSTLTNSATAGDPYFGAATGALSNALNPAYNSVGNYMNPYTSGVVNATMANMNEQNQQQQQQVLGNAIAKGAMGGDRVGVAQSELARQQNLANQQTISGLWNQNYSQALQAAQGQQALGLQAANTYSGLGTAASTAAVQSGLAALQGGENQYNRDYAQYQAEQSYPFQKASWLGSIVEGLGSSAGGSSTTTSQGGNGLSSIFGGALGLGALLLRSDERSKEDIEPIGKAFDGQTLYRFRYKGEPQTHVGFLAQEVEQRHPEAVGESGGVKGVDYRAATEDAADRGKFAPGGVVPYGGTPGTTPATGADASYIPAPSPVGGGSALPKGGSSGASQQQDPLQGVMSGVKGVNDMAKTGRELGLPQKIASLTGADASATLPQEATMAAQGLGTAAAPAAGAAGGTGGLMSALMGLFSKGGVVGRKGYDDGGDVWPSFDDADMLRNDGLSAPTPPPVQGPPIPPAAPAKPFAASRLPDTQDYRPEDSPSYSTPRSDPGVVPSPPERPAGGVLGIKPTPPPKDNEKGYRPEDSPKAASGAPTADAPYANDPLMNLAARQAGLVTPQAQAEPIAPETAADDYGVIRNAGLANPAMAAPKPQIPLAPEGSGDELMNIAAAQAAEVPKPGVAPQADAPAMAGLVPLPPPRPKGQILGGQGGVAPDQTGSVPPPSNDNAPAAPALPAPISVAPAPKVHGMTAKQANADNPDAPVGRLSAGQQARVAQGQPIYVPRLSGASVAGAQNWLQSLSNAGLDHMHAAMMAGNIQTESSFRPDAWNHAENAHGAMQWEGDRWDGPNGLQAFAARSGRDWRDPQVQANFMRWEGENIPRLKGPWQQFLAAQTPQQAQEALAHFIGYKRDDRHGNDNARLANGMAILGGSPTAVAQTGNATGNDTTGSIPQTGGVVAQNAAAPTGNEGGILQGLKNALGIPQGLSDEASIGLLQAGLGIMGGTSRNPFVNIGQGGQKGVEAYLQGRNMRREEALAQSDIGYKKGQLGLEGQRVDLEGKRLAQDADLKRQELAQQSAYQASEIAKNQAEVSAGRYNVTQGPNGFIVQDRYNPLNTRFMNMDELQAAQASGEIPSGPPAIGTPPPAVAGAIAPPKPGGVLTPQAAPEMPAGPAPSGLVAPPAGPAPAPSGPVPPAAAVEPSYNMAPAKGNLEGLEPEVRSAPFSMMQFGQEGPKVLGQIYQKKVEGAGDVAAAAQSTNLALDQMQEYLSQIPANSWVAPGTAHATRVEWARALNTTLNKLGFQSQIPPEEVAAGEALIKAQTGLGFELAKTLGSREAGFIVQQAVNSVPGGALSPEGSKKLIAAMKAANQRKIDYADYIQKYGARSAGDLTGADATFNKFAPPELYALMANTPAQQLIPAVQMLRRNPGTWREFESHVGQGTAKYVLGLAGQQ